MKLLYFAWLRTKVGLHEEEISPPASVSDVEGLIAWLQTRGPNYAEALANASVVRVAVNQEYASPSHRIRPGDEVALFPPVTGG